MGNKLILDGAEFKNNILLHVWKPARLFNRSVSILTTNGGQMIDRYHNKRMAILAEDTDASVEPSEYKAIFIPYGKSLRMKGFPENVVVGFVVLSTEDVEIRSGSAAQAANYVLATGGFSLTPDANGELVVDNASHAEGAYYAFVCKNNTSPETAIKSDNFAIFYCVV